MNTCIRITRSGTVLPMLVVSSVLSVTPSGLADVVTVEFTAQVSTVSDRPLGFDITARQETVVGSFTYDTRTTDTNTAADRGDYGHRAGGAFTATLLGTTITGSSTPFVQVENLSSDTFRFIDGAGRAGDEGGLMRVDGQARNDLELTIAFTDSSGGAFDSDALPAPLPFAEPPLARSSPLFPHTFSLSDNDGTMLLQLSSIQTASIVEDSSGAGTDDANGLDGGATGGAGCPAQVLMGSGRVVERFGRALSAGVLYRFRDEVLSRGTRGRQYIKWYYEHAAETGTILANDADLAEQGVRLLVRLAPRIEAALDGRVFQLTADDMQAIDALAMEMQSHASPDLVDTLKRFRSDLHASVVLP